MSLDGLGLASKENVTKARFHLFGLQCTIGSRALAGCVGLSDARNRVWGGTAQTYRSREGAAGGLTMTDIIRRKPASFEEYWLASKAWQRKGLTLGAARALANAGFLTVEDLQSSHAVELATLPRIGAKSLAILNSLRS